VHFPKIILYALLILGFSLKIETYSTAANVQFFPLAGLPALFSCVGILINAYWLKIPVPLLSPPSEENRHE
jgi:hypothetical protein